MKNICFRTAVVALSLFLAGCYETELPLLDKGDRTPLQGLFECRKSISGETERVAFKEVKDGVTFPSYTYHGKSSETLTLKEISKGFFLAQVVSGKPRPQYLYIDFTSNDGFIASVADLMSKEAYIEQLAKRHNISNRTGSDMGVMLLQGSKDEITSFLTAHEKHFLSTIIYCQRISYQALEPEASISKTSIPQHFIGTWDASGQCNSEFDTETRLIITDSTIAVYSNKCSIIEFFEATPAKLRVLARCSGEGDEWDQPFLFEVRNNKLVQRYPGGDTQERVRCSR